MPADSCLGCDVVTDTASRTPIQERGSVKAFNTSSKRQRGTSITTLESSFDRQSRYPRTRLLHAYDLPSSPNLDIIAGRQESHARNSTAPSSEGEEEIAASTTGIASVNASRGFRARLMLSHARKTIENHKPAWSDTERKRGRPRRPFVMDIILELKAQYAGYTTEDMYVTFEAMRRTEDARPVFEHLAHDFSAGMESVDAYWDSQARVWQDWKSPSDDCVNNHAVVVRGSPPSTGPTFGAVPVISDIRHRPFGTVGTPLSNSLSIGRACYPDSIERSTASWCPVLECDYVAGYHSHSQDQA
ncbi:hypothetical protein NP233_g10114 [Leucocoprinus birnbaumii]|uniref:Uncharacterized protein n=1 Tax=Leucocoprinus birnbaumii TaxID=56174 RepID=A0AAD5VMK7_9AGAR|nr:hypothetical protein NP233_g10114 [Leucocoprinus birnbaumii]